MSTRKWVWYWTLVALVGAFVWLIGQAHAKNRDIIGISRKVLQSAVVINPKADNTSAAFDELPDAEVQAVQVLVSSTGGAPNLAIAILGSVDGVTFAPPTVGNTPATITVDGTWIVPIASPLVSRMKITLANLSATVTSTCSVTVSSQ